MKKLIYLILFIISALTLSACSGSKNQEPKYLGMSIISQQSLLQSKDDSFNLNSLNHRLTSSTGEVIIDEEPLENDIEELVTIEVVTDDEVKYYVSQGEKFIVRIHLSNPDNYLVQSFTLNGKIYANYMFEQGSTLELLLLEVTAPFSSGYIDYTIDAIKYIDGTEIKDAIMDGSKTIKAGIRYDNEPLYVGRLENISTTSISLDFDIIDIHQLTRNQELAIYLSNGNQVIEKKDLTIGNNKITFNNLEMGKTYEYGVVGVYDVVDGRELQAHWLYTQTFVTEKAFTFNNYQSTQTSISFNIEKLGSVGNIKYFNLIDEATNQVVRKIEDTSIREITNLFSNRFYIVELVFDYEVNQQLMTDSVKLKISTLPKTEPVITLDDLSVTDSTILGQILVSDPDNLNTITKVEIYQGNTLIDINESRELEFSNLNFYTNYIIKIHHTYNLNDGVGLISKITEFAATTAPYFRFSDVRVLNTTAVSEGETIILQANIDNPSNAIYSKVIVNGKEYAVSPASTQNRLRVEIVNIGQFAGGNTKLEIEEVFASIGGKTFQIEVPKDSFAMVFINGNLTIESISFVDENFNELPDYVFPNEKIYVLFKFNNPTGFAIDSMMIRDLIYNSERDITSQLIKFDDNNYYYEINLIDGWNNLELVSLSYSNNFISKSIIFGEKPVAKGIYKVKSSIVRYINSPNDLLNMNQGYYYELSNDVDLSGLNWFGGDFEGVFDGKGYTIKNMSNVSNYQNQDLELGLFKSGNGIIKNIDLQEITFIVELSSTNNQFYVIYYGGFFARANHIKMNNVSIDNNSTIFLNNASDAIMAGGLIGQIYSYGLSTLITNSNNGGSMFLRANQLIYMGGLVGEQHSEGIDIINSYNTGELSAENLNNHSTLGGLIGRDVTVRTTSIINSYNTGKLTGTGFTGGLIGESIVYGLLTVKNSFNTGIIIANEMGNLIGHLPFGLFDIANNYTIFLFKEPLYESLVTTDQLSSKPFYTGTLGWDESIWNFDNLDPVNNKYPTLR